MDQDVAELKESSMKHHFFEFTFPHKWGRIGFVFGVLLFIVAGFTFLFSLSIPDVIQTDDAVSINSSSEFETSEFVEQTLGKGFDGQKGAYFTTVATIESGTMIERYCTTNDEGETQYHATVADSKIPFAIGGSSFTGTWYTHNLNPEYSVGDSCDDDIKQGDQVRLFILKQDDTFTILSMSEYPFSLPEVTQRENSQRAAMFQMSLGALILMLITPSSLANDIRKIKKKRSRTASVIYDGHEFSFSSTTFRNVDQQDWILSPPSIEAWTPTKYGPDGDGATIAEHPTTIGTPHPATFTPYSICGSIFVLFNVWLIADLNARDTDVFGAFMGDLGKYILVLFALGWTIQSIRKWKLLHNIIDTPTSRVRSVAVGSAELVGQVRPHTNTLSFSVGGRSYDGMVGFYWLEEEEVCSRDSDGKESCRWHTIASESQQSNFILHDGSGGILVDVGSWNEVDMGERLDTWRIGKHRWTVTTLCCGDPVYALGTVDKRTLDEQEDGLDTSIPSANIIMRGNRLEGMQAKLSRGTEFSLLGGLRSTTESVFIPIVMLFASIVPFIW